MTMYMLPSALALVASVILLGTFFYGRKSSSSFYNLILVFACMSACELLGFLRFFEQSSLEGLLRVYYVTVIIAIAFSARYVGQVTGNRLKNIPAVIFGFALVISAIVLFTNLIIAGSESIGYMVTAIKGEHYMAFRVYSLLGILASCSMLFIGYFKPAADTIKQQSQYCAMAFSPIIFTSIGVLALMMLGIKVNATVVMPLAMIAFSVMAYRGEHVFRSAEENVQRGNQDKKLASLKIQETFDQFSDGDINYRDAVSDIEKIMVLYKYNQNEGNASSTAKQMGMPRSSLYSIFNRLMIETGS